MPLWKTHLQKNPSLQFVPLHIAAFQENGVWFARAEEFQIMGHGDSEIEATRNVYNMVLRAVLLAFSEGRLPAILKKAGVEIQIGIPQEDATQPERKGLWFVPLTNSADHVPVHH